MTVQRSLTVLLQTSALLALWSSQALATFELEVAPRRGGQHIRFEASEPGDLLRNEEVTVTVTSDEGFQYRLFQTVYQPLTNETGQTIPQGDFVMFSPSSPLGTLRTQLETPVTMGQMPVYTSPSSGDSDTFVLVYNVRVPEDQPGGVYRTQIQFTAEPVTPAAGATQRVVNMEVRVEIRPTFRVTLRSPGGQSIDLGRVNEENPVAAKTIELVVDSNIGVPYRILHRLAEAPLSGEGAVLDEEVLTVTAAGGTRRGALTSPGTAVPVPSAPTLVYASDDLGSGETLTLRYAVSGGDRGLPAGSYRGTLSLEVRSSSAVVSPEALNLPLSFEVEPIFFLDVNPAQSGTGFHFGTFQTGEERQVQQVRIQVRSNLGKPYQISQIVSRPLTNSAGDTIPYGHFIYSAAEPRTGAARATAEIPVPEGESVVFTSDRDGAPEEVILSYVLTVPAEARSGSYGTDLRYSITTL